MYQVKTNSTWEIIVSGNLCKVVDSRGSEQFVGNWDQCVEWLAARGVSVK